MKERVASLRGHLRFPRLSRIVCSSAVLSVSVSAKGWLRLKIGNWKDSDSSLTRFRPRPSRSRERADFDASVDFRNGGFSSSILLGPRAWMHRAVL